MNLRTSELTSDEAKKQYGGYWTLSILNRKDGQHICYCCESPSAGRSSMNIWGTICDFETCDECHAKVDGHRADSIPEFAATAEAKETGA